MTWEEFNEIGRASSVYEMRRPTNIECPKCGAMLWKRTDIVLSTYPPTYRYECDACGWFGTSDK